MDSFKSRFRRLFALHLDGLITDEERAELAQLGKERPEHVADVVDELVLHALLNWQSGNLTQQYVALEIPSAVLPEGSSESKEPAAKFSPSSGRKLLWAVAAVLLVACGVSAWRALYWRPVADVAIADIVEQSGVQWADNTNAIKDGHLIHPGRLASLGGEYTLQFRAGPTVRVVGPTSLDIKSKMLVQLDHGQATASVPESSIGFTIASTLVNVVDQGTQFGIAVGNGRTDVIVFDGKVDMQSNVGNGGGQTRLTQGEAVQVDLQGSIGRLVDVRRDVRGRWWTDNRSESDKSLIAQVTDNIWGGGEKYVCYQTTRQGLTEDALAYSDSPYHQWNGLTPDGLPEFLRGADYIKTFNDYRYLLEFEMKVTLARPANLYVFADNRIKPPDWLVANFEDTGVDIGLDEGPWLSQVEEKNRKWDTNTIAVGGGNSIDNTFSVWRRRCVDGGTVSLGNAGAWGADGKGIGGKGGRAMYGIAATPLDVPDGTRVPADRSIGN